MALTRDFRETVQADAKRDPTFRRGLLSDALESLLTGEVPLGKELLRDYINATVGFPKLAAQTNLHVKTLHQMFARTGTLPPAICLRSLRTCSARKACASRSAPCTPHCARKSGRLRKEGKRLLQWRFGVDREKEVFVPVDPAR